LSYLAPCSIHFLMIATSPSVSAGKLLSGGGIIIAVSVELILRNISERSGLPGTIACARGCSFNALYASSGISSRKPACLLLASGPWHLKHLSEKIGRTWKL